ncbi:Protein translocase subunit SecE [Candidatus Johnevansia muelleri]|uniref:Protein translocase subunit SecE n=1 Tax=Candidatus Johnevansia muelleri TaxID=1495769 RepID=A0A078KHD5_9GAMM|nr:Protein translocase subunit SecE [Candidatus Evansia muelleri]
MIILYYILNNFLKSNIMVSFFIICIGIIIGFITTKLIEQKLKYANKEIKSFILPKLKETIQTTIFIIITVFILFFFIFLLDIIIKLYIC